MDLCRLWRLSAALAAAFLLLGQAARAQAITQSGPILNGGGHVPMYLPQGSGSGLASAMDSGPASGGATGYGLSELLLQQRGPGTGPEGTNMCDWSTYATNPAGANYLCWGANVSGAPAIVSSGPLTVYLAGIPYPFPGAGTGNVIGCTTPYPRTGSLSIWGGLTALCDASTISTVQAIGGNTNLGFFQSGATIGGTLSNTASQSWEQMLSVIATDTATNTTGIAKLNAITGTEIFGGGSTGPGARNGVWGTVQQIGATTYNGIDIFQSGVFGYVQVDVGNAVGQTLDYNGVTGLVTLDGGLASNANTIVAGEFDADVGANSTTQFRTGVLIDSGGGNVPSVVRGSVFDAALSIAADNSAGTAGTWKNGIVFGNPNGEWPFTTDGILMAAYGSGTMNASIGIYLANVTFGGAAIQTPGFTVQPNGALDIYSIPDGTITSIFGGPSAAVRFTTAGTSAFVSATNSAGSTYENLGLNGSQVILEPQGAGSFAQVQGKFNLSTVTGASSASLYVCADSGGNVLLQSGAC